MSAGAGTVARRAHLAAVQLDQALDQRQPQPEAAICAPRGPIRLGERIEHVRQEFRRNPDAVVADRELGDVVFGAADREAHMAAGMQGFFEVSGRARRAL